MSAGIDPDGCLGATPTCVGVGGEGRNGYPGSDAPIVALTRSYIVRPLRGRFYFLDAISIFPGSSVLRTSTTGL